MECKVIFTEWSYRYPPYTGWAIRYLQIIPFQLKLLVIPINCRTIRSVFEIPKLFRVAPISFGSKKQDCGYVTQRNSLSNSFWNITNYNLPALLWDLSFFFQYPWKLRPLLFDYILLRTSPALESMECSDFFQPQDIICLWV